MRHLDATAMAELAGRDPAAVAWFREHLASPCEVCETFLATHADPLDGQADALLLALAPERKTEAEVVPLRTPARARRFAPPPGRYLGWMAGAIAASVLMVVLVPRVKGPTKEATEWTGVKGPGRISLELAVVARSTDGGLRRLDSGADVTSDEVLLLRYHATESGTALLYQQREQQAPELLGRFPLAAGTHDLEGPDGLAGVSLDSDEGRLALALVAFAPGEPATEQDALAALAADGSPDARPGTVVRFDVRVQSGQTQAP
ncbi:hypothetical protein HJC22_07395 [Corallococcus exiguus]|uniref:hypothetical protein n=1 Tax=Corallococcus TaxID=83461 RepID=UPI000EA0B2F7|nr:MULTISPECIES: hypothetical protein [Corallococcus]NNC15551.1 hypothetical protein [Corallococcus exiguus]RKH26143.1 hypothetical protein D7V77_15620 [Corallococcus sp. CA041A]RUO90805.1 hypothetical protein D7Y11_23195 [Corallococcus sp. AB018]